MTNLNFDQLIEVYKEIEFSSDGESGSLTIPSKDVLDIVQIAMKDHEAGEKYGLFSEDEVLSLEIGSTTALSIRPPKISLGILATTFDAFLHNKKNCWEEPKNYFIIEGKVSKNQTNETHRLTSYKTLLDIIRIFIDSASHFDEVRGELLFFGTRKVEVPLILNEQFLDGLSLSSCIQLKEIFTENIHLQQKQTILFEEIIQMSQSLPSKSRLECLLRNLDVIVKHVSEGYKIFVSNFSYRKIRNELERAKSDYILRIHNTLVDIQGQVLGIPLATVLAATQIKTTSVSSDQHLINASVLFGVVIFSILLFIALVSQHYTLRSIKYEATKEEERLDEQFEDLKIEFSSIFTSIKSRIQWQFAALYVIGFLAVAGLAIAIYFYSVSTQASPLERNDLVTPPTHTHQTQSQPPHPTHSAQQSEPEADVVHSGQKHLPRPSPDQNQTD